MSDGDSTFWGAVSELAAMREHIPAERRRPSVLDALYAPMPDLKDPKEPMPEKKTETIDINAALALGEVIRALGPLALDDRRRVLAAVATYYDVQPAKVYR